jgi:hypothetical protein
MVFYRLTSAGRAFCVSSGLSRETLPAKLDRYYRAEGAVRKKAGDTVSVAGRAIEQYLYLARYLCGCGACRGRGLPASTSMLQLSQPGAGVCGSERGLGLLRNADIRARCRREVAVTAEG